MAFDFSLLGEPVEFGQISRELKKLWESTHGTDTRASLVNFAVYCQGVDALESNTKLISEFTRNHACRAMLLASVPNAPQPAVKAWINAHCHLSRAGAKQVCCEQITILLEGSAQHRLANVLFANLDSDLPLYLWWQGEFNNALDEAILPWTDRLIYDSRDWDDEKKQFAILQNARKHSGARMILCDLNWTRTLHLRQALAQTFDHPCNLELFPKLRRVMIHHAPNSCSTAVLLTSWIAAQLGWEFTKREGGRLSYRGPDRGEIVCELKAVEGAAISLCELGSAEAKVTITRDAGSAFHRSEFRSPDGRVFQHLMPAGKEDIPSLLDDELTFGGAHKVYSKALAGAVAVF
ncbi:MAG TPA: glucose-6-phosphate dehydrogenase assembly protein OpcA [Chthoniobacteraceae bacterium]